MLGSNEEAKVRAFCGGHWPLKQTTRPDRNPMQLTFGDISNATSKLVHAVRAQFSVLAANVTCTKALVNDNYKHFDATI